MESTKGRFYLIVMITILLIISLSGVVSAIPRIQVSSTTFNETLDTGQNMIRPFKITNTGESELHYAFASKNTQEIVGMDPGSEYYWTDSNTSSTLTYDWQDISTTGIELTSVPSEGDIITTVNLSFPFPFYETRSQVIGVNSHGYLEVGGHPGFLFGNFNIPNPSFGEYKIAAFGDSLSTIAYGGQVFFKDEGNRAIFQFQNLQLKSTFSDPLTFQIVLDREGTITYYYKDMVYTTSPYTGPSVGIQKDSDEGMNIAYRNNYVQSNFAIQIAKMPSWYYCSSDSGVIAPGEILNMDFIFDATGLNPGLYTSNFFIFDELDANVTSVEVTCTLTVSETNYPPNAHIVAPFQANRGSVVLLDGSTSADFMGGSIVSYAWDLDNDGVYNDATTATVNHTFATVGEATVGLKVTDDQGGTGIYHGQILINNARPVAIYTVSNLTPLTGEEITLDATGSYDPDGTLDNIYWYYDSDSVFNDEGLIATKAFLDNGTHTVELRLKDNDYGFSTEYITIEVQNRAPIAVIQHTTAYAGMTVNFDASQSTDLDGQITLYEWSLDGDDIYETTGMKVSQTFASAGTQTVKLKVTDDDGATHFQTVGVTVSADMPSITITPTSLVGQLVTIDPVSTLTFQNNGNAPLNISLSSGAPVIKGTDNFGYYWTDSNAAGGPGFDWNDISGIGTRLGTISSSPNQDQPVNLTQFTFPFYGQDYSQITVSSNGYVLAGDGSGGYTNSILPDSSAPRNLIAGYFDILDPSIDGDIYYYEEADRVTIQFNQVSDYYQTGTFTYQIVLQSDGSIFFYYQDMNGVTTSSTVGIQNYEREDGLTIAYNEPYLQNGLAVQIGIIADWVKPAVADLQIPALTSVDVDVTLEGVGLPLGTFATNLYVHHNDPNVASPILIPCTLEITNVKPEVTITSLSPYSPYTNQEITFTGSGTDADGTIALYEWDMDNDGQFDDGLGEVVKYTYSENGTYTIYLRVTDNQGGTAITSREFTVHNRLPQANIIMDPLRVAMNQTVTFNASSSVDLDGTIQSYAWDLDDDNVYNDGTTAIVSKAFTTAGTYTVRVQITDDDGDISTKSLTFEVKNWPQMGVSLTSLTETLPANSTSTHTVTISNTSVSDVSLTYTTKPVFDLTNIRRGGPDAYGYYWTDSDMPGGPIYRWRDIRNIGKRLKSVSERDTDSYTIYPGFKIPLYDREFSSIKVFPDGYLSLYYGWYNGENYSLPSISVVGDFIALFHDDLSPASGGDIYALEETDQVTIQYEQVRNAAGTGTYTFQAVIKSDGTLTFYYKDMNGPVDSATVGIQNHDKDMGLTVVHNNTYLKDELAVQIQTNPGWLTLPVSSGTIVAGQSQDLTVDINTAEMRFGQYSGYLELSHDAGNMTDPVQIPFDLTVSNTSPIIQINYPTSVFLNAPVTFDVSNSTDMDGDIISVGWDLDGNGSYTDATGMSVVHTFTALGEQSIHVQVIDDATVTSVQTITVNVIEPPQIIVNPTFVVETMDKSTSTVRTVNISNPGVTDLTVEVDGLNTALGQYTWADSTMVEGPQYRWEDISSIGTKLHSASLYDNGYDQINFSFDFPFYGDQYSSAYVSANGYLTFGESTFDYSNGNIPGTSCPANLIAPFFDDLEPRYGNVYYLDTGESLIVQYNDMEKYTEERLTFQMVLEKDGSIYFFYNTLDGTLNSATIGIQNHDQSEGVQIANNQAYLTNQMAIQIEPKRWVTLSSDSANILSGANTDITLTFDSSIAHLLSYTGSLQVRHNDPETANPILIPMILNVNNDPPVPELTVSSLSVLTDEVVNLDASTSTDADGQVVYYEWDFDNNGSFDDAVGESTSYSFVEDGIYPVSVRLTDNSGETVTASVEITVTNREPLAQYTYTPIMPEPGVEITFDASTASDADGTIISYGWDLDGNGTYTDVTGLTATCTFNEVGSYPIGLKVIDNDGAEGVSVIHVDVRTDWPQIAVSPSSFTETTDVTTPLSKYVTISNIGGQDLQYSLHATYDPSNMIEGGPFDGGYYWSDSDTAGGPMYTWNDISLIGTRLYQLTDSSFGSQYVKMSFSFPFYGQMYDRVNVTTTGHLNLGTNDEISYHKYGLPYLLPSIDVSANLIAPFQTQQYVVDGGDIYYYDDGDRLIVQYDKVKNSSRTYSYTYQVVLDKDGTITFYYKEMAGPVNIASIGIQNGTQGDGFSIAYKTDYLRDQFAVQIATQPNWIKFPQATGTVSPGAQVDVEFILDSTLRKSSLYNAQLEIEHNGNNIPKVSVPVSFTVENVAPVAKITYDRAYVGYPVNFDATTSYDLDGNIVSYGWDTDGDTVYTDYVGSTLTHTFSSLGTYAIGLEVTDDDGFTVAQTVMVEVANPPQISVSPGSFTETLAGITSVGRTLNIANAGFSNLHYSIERSNTLGANGYIWTDSDRGGIEYVWNDISSTGTLLTMDYPYYMPVKLPFEFPYYGELFKEIEVREGFITFRQGYWNKPTLYAGLPNTYAAKNMIAPLYRKDFYLSYGGQVYSKVEEDRVTIQFTNLETTYSHSDTYTFQIVLFKNGDIHFYYKNIVDVSTGLIGIQNSTKDQGVTIAYNTEYLKDQMAIRLTNRPLWVEMTPVTGTVASGANENVSLNFNATGLARGTYEANLEVYHDAADTVNPVIIPASITVTNLPPLAVIEHPADIFTGEVTLDASASIDNDGTIVSYAWDLDNDSIYNEGTMATVSKTFTDNGVYPIGLKLVDNDGAETIERIDLIVQNRVPIMDATFAPRLPESGQEVTFDASKSTDADGQILNYSWDLDGDGSFGDAITSIATKTFDAVGDYVVQVKLIDDDGAETIETLNVQVNNWPHISLTPNSISQTMYRGESKSTIITLKNTGSLDLEFTIPANHADGYGGYYWLDSDDPSGPKFVWNDISTTGTELSISGAFNEFESVPLSFEFPFYGVQYDHIFVSTNGYITFGEGSSLRNNYGIGSSLNPNLLIAGFFDDLDNGQLYFKDLGNQAVIQFNQVEKYGYLYSKNTFQIVLNQDGTITYYYQTMGVLNSSATIGIQKEVSSGVQVVYNQNYVKDQLAVCIYPNTARLTANPASGIIPAGGTLDVTMTYNSTGLSLGQYNKPFKIQHNASNQPNPLEVSCIYEVVNRPPVVNIVQPPALIYMKQTITLTNISYDTDGTIQSYEWDLDGDGFDDGTTSSINHSFATPGEHLVKLQVTDNDGAVMVGERVITVTNRSPIAQYQYTPSSPMTGEPMTFDAASSTDQDGMISRYEWDLDHDGLFDDATGVRITHTFGNNGMYSIGLRVTDDFGAIDEHYSLVTVENRAPVAAFSVQPLKPKTGEIVTLDASESTDADGFITTYDWDLNGDSMFNDGSGSIVEITFDSAGTYTILLRVRDDDAAITTISRTITVEVGNVVSDFTARQDVNSVNLVWDNLPQYIIDNWILVRNETGRPTTPTDGVVVYEGHGKAVADSNLPAGTYYYGLYPKTYNMFYAAAFATITVEETPFNKQEVVYQSGNDNSYSTTKTAYLWENENYSKWGKKGLQIGRGNSGKISDIWIYYPEVIGSDTGQIPTNAQIERAKLTLKVSEFAGTYGQKYRLKLYRVTDPDGLGTPYFGIQDGYRQGLTLKYRDHRLGKEIPWAMNVENIQELLAGVQPIDVAEFDYNAYYQHDINEIQFDVTSAVQSWVNGQPNQGWFITIEGEWETSEILTLHGTEATQISERSALEVVYANQLLTSQPDSVTDVKAIPGVNKITLTWNLPNTYHTGVKVIRKIGAIPFDPADGELIYEGTGTSMIDPDCSPTVPYYYALFTYDDLRRYSIKEWIKVISNSPSAPVLSEPEVGAGYVDLLWSNIGAYSYQVYRLATEELEPTCLAITTDNFYKDLNVETITYEYWVVPLKFCLGQSSEVKVATPSASTITPTAPTNLDIIEVGSTYISLSWTDQADDETGYQIERLNQSGTWDVVGKVSFTKQNFTDINLLPKTSYQYRVKAMNSAGSSAYVESPVAVTNNVAVAITNLNWSVIAPGLVELSWNDSPNELFYSLTVYDGAGNFILATSLSKDATNYTLTHLPGDTDIFVRIDVIGEDGSVSVSTEVFRTAGNTKQDIF